MTNTFDIPGVSEHAYFLRKVADAGPSCADNGYPFFSRVMMIHVGFLNDLMSMD